METLRESLTQHTAEFLAGLAVAVLLLSFWTIRLAVAQSRMAARQREDILGHGGGETDEMRRERVRLQDGIRTLESRLAELEERARDAKRHVGLVRYDAFEDVGGQQSFALAFYDDQGDGAILSGLVGRLDCRVYCKILQGGRSDRELTQEEKQAVREAAMRAVGSQGRA